MTATTSNPTTSSNYDLAQVVEPLASYICAADRPREVLLSALAKLFNEVKETNHVTLMHFSCPRMDSLGLAS
jgi:hypothetical protein